MIVGWTVSSLGGGPQCRPTVVTDISDAHRPLALISALVRKLSAAVGGDLRVACLILECRHSKRTENLFSKITRLWILHAFGRKGCAVRWEVATCWTAPAVPTEKPRRATRQGCVERIEEVSSKEAQWFVNLPSSTGRPDKAPR